MIKDNEPINLLIIIDGDEPDKIPILDKMNVDEIFLLYLSPRVKCFRYKEELELQTKKKIKINIINPKKIVDFNHTRKVLLEFISSIPNRLKISNSNLSEYLTIQGLNMWWTSGVTESTPYKQNIFQNLYYLFAISNSIKKFKINTVWFQVNSLSLESDIILMLDNVGIKYYKQKKSKKPNQHNYLNWLLSLSAHTTYLILSKIICQKLQKSEKNINIFYSSYPNQIYFDGGIPKAKIYGDLPKSISKYFGNDVCCLYCLSQSSIITFRRLLRDIKKLYNFQFIPINRFLSIWDILRIFFSPIRHWKYIRLKKTKQYHNIFYIDGINMFNTFDHAIKISLISNESIENLICYHAFRKLPSYYKNIFQIIYHLEFHSWEVAIISGIRSINKSIYVIGLQQSAPNPILLSFFFAPELFKIKKNGYPLPNLILCSGKLHKDLLISSGINSEMIEVIGHIIGYTIHELSNKVKKQKREELNLPVNRKICLVTCSIDLSLTEGIIYLLKQVVDKLPEILFIIKGHPDSPVDNLLCKYNLDHLENIKSMKHPITTLLPLVDYFLSTSTSVSQEALQLGIPQINLDVGGLPYSNPLHLIPNLIADAENSNDLLEFFINTEKFKISKKMSYLFMEHSKINPYEKFIYINKKLLTKTKTFINIKHE